MLSYYMNYRTIKLVGLVGFEPAIGIAPRRITFTLPDSNWNSALPLGEQSDALGHYATDPLKLYVIPLWNYCQAPCTSTLTISLLNRMMPHIGLSTALPPFEV